MRKGTAHKFVRLQSIISLANNHQIATARIISPKMSGIFKTNFGALPFSSVSFEGKKHKLFLGLWLNAFHSRCVHYLSSSNKQQQRPQIRKTGINISKEGIKSAKLGY